MAGEKTESLDRAAEESKMTGNCVTEMENLTHC